MSKKNQSQPQVEAKTLHPTGAVESALGKAGGMAGGAVDTAWTAPGRAISASKEKVKHARMSVSRKARDVAADLSVRLDPDRLPMEAGTDDDVSLNPTPRP